MDRLAAHPYAYLVKDFIMKNRRSVVIQGQMLQAAVPKLGEDGRSYVTIYGKWPDSDCFFFVCLTCILLSLTECLRKSARGDVTTISPGTGKITINGKDISYFHHNQSREQVRCLCGLFAQLYNLDCLFDKF